MAIQPIQHVVILVKENHGFDNYFGTFPGANGMALPRSPNPPPQDPDHRHGALLTRHTTALRAQFIEQDIPQYFAYARQFTLCDNYFTDVAGPSTPNHLMLVAADSPIIANPPSYRRGGGGTVFDLPSLPAQLDAAKLSWGNYGGYVFDMIKLLVGRNKFPSTQFKTDALAGNLTISETLNGQFKPNQFICVTILPRATNGTRTQDTFLKTTTTNDLPVISTNAASGLLP